MTRLRGDPLRDLMQVPREWVGEHPEFSWCLDQDQSEHVPEVERGDDCVYVLKVTWDNRTEG
ncbi:MAG TPA: hypothetical protein ENH00_06415 [Actinobacteria bacterium]|nr:hypothetical protein [Actinomycetota bacterium]